MRLWRNTVAAAIGQRRRSFGVLRPPPATSEREIAVSAASRWQLRNCQCQHMATSHLGHLGCSTHQPAVVEAVAAVVHRWVDPLAAAPGAQPAYSACRRKWAPRKPGRSVRPWVER